MGQPRLLKLVAALAKHAVGADEQVRRKPYQQFTEMHGSAHPVRWARWAQP